MASSQIFSCAGYYRKRRPEGKRRRITQFVRDIVARSEIAVLEIGAGKGDRQYQR
jgi:hypothetical protein